MGNMTERVVKYQLHCVEHISVVHFSSYYLKKNEEDNMLVNEHLLAQKIVKTELKNLFLY